MNDLWSLGLSLSHNGSACLLRGDEIAVAIQQERLTRIKRDWLEQFDEGALQYCCEAVGIAPSQLDRVTWVSVGNAAESIRTRRSLERLEQRVSCPVERIPHHLAHATAAFATSGFDEASVLVVDGGGEGVRRLRDYPRELAGLRPAQIPGVPEDSLARQEIVGIYRASGTDVVCVEKHTGRVLFDRGGVRVPGSLGSMFAAAAKRIFHEGFNAAGKVMGLAPYGEPTIPVEELLEISRDGRLIFKHGVFDEYARLGEPWPEHEESYQGLAASIQAALEFGLEYLWTRTAELCSSGNFAYAGGVALNSVANEKLIRRRIFSEHYIMPASEDSGVAIGAAYHGLWSMVGRNTNVRLNRDSLGRCYGREDVAEAIESVPFVEAVECRDFIESAADALCEGKVIGWFCGGAELGPRALGHRSILFDPRRHRGKDTINRRVKHRESFRPFAPVILAERLTDWFEVDGNEESPFMLRVLQFREEVRDKVPSVVHVDGTGRVQTVTKEVNGEYYELIERFRSKTGVPILLNTSFNIMGEPIVKTPADALWCLLFSRLDLVYFDGFAAAAKAPGTPSILDVPLCVKVDLSEVAWSRAGLGSRNYILMDRGRWGMRRSVLRSDVFELLDHVDGERSMRELCELTHQDRELTEVEMLRALASLHRSGALEFRSDTGA